MVPPHGVSGAISSRTIVRGGVMTMSESENWPTEEPEEVGKEKARDKRTGNSAAAARMQHQAKWVDLQIQQAMARGDFDNLPGYGKPIADLGSTHDPDWWLKRLVERERISVLPPSLQVRKDDLELDGVLDELVVRGDGAQGGRGLQRAGCQGADPAAGRAADDHPDA